jgi:hypothetical protein
VLKHGEYDDHDDREDYVNHDDFVAHEVGRMLVVWRKQRWSSAGAVLEQC